MGYTKVALEDKILEMYPEVRKHGISVYRSGNSSKISNWSEETFRRCFLC